MIRFSHLLALSILSHAFFLAGAQSQTTTLIPANEAAAHVGEYATVERVVAKVFTSKSGNTFLNIGASYPNQTFTGWIPPASAVSKASTSKSLAELRCTKASRKFGSMRPSGSRFSDRHGPWGWLAIYPR